ncbi:hypothetical protein SAMN06265367_105193 [Algoriphagus winogradskyi]|uniref:Secretion system C-terminal sorting domain-containing protein n=2 Tax=Algoriphagus winogradskyi TaxID=237017 RepID=A0ABY1P759_9BACT|nr:hypothetical protein SAMN06265367_105193 [Algoriphagus winogradskyi]
MFWGGDAWGQSCPNVASLGGCARTLNSNSAIPASLSSGDVVCLGADRSSTINMQNISGLILYIPSGINFTGNLTNIGNNVRIINCGSFSINWSLTSTNSVFENYGSFSGNFSLSNGSAYLNSGIGTGNLTINDGTLVTNSGTLNLGSLNFDNNNSGMVFDNTSASILNVTNSSTISGTITLNGTSTFSNNLTFYNNNTVRSVIISGAASLTVGQKLSISKNTIINVTNPGNLIPNATISVNNLEFQNNGGTASNLNIGVNTIFNVKDITDLQSGVSQLNIEGNFRTGTNLNPVSECKNSLIVGNNGGASPTRIQIIGNGLLDVTGSASINKHITAEDNGTINISCDLKTENNGNNSITLSDNVNLSVGGTLTLNKPMYVNGSSSVNIKKDLILPNVASELVINDDVNFYVGGNTSVESPIRMNDNAYVTFDGNVSLPNVGGAQFIVNDNADVLITSNLTKSGGNIGVSGTGQLVICDQRLPAGSITGSFPSSGSSGVSVGSSPAYYGGCRILPVEFLYYMATYQSKDRSVLLEWSTSKEWENSHFEIERAVNSVKEWETIGRIEGNGYSSKPVEYNFSDFNLPLSGGNIFYRLKQVDFSGKYSYSRTKAIQVEATHSNSTWVAYPNPSASGSDVSVQLTQLQNYQDQSISIRLVNMLGDGKSTILTSPEEVTQVVSEWMRNKKAGIYILDIRWGSYSQQIKLLRN